MLEGLKLEQSVNSLQTGALPNAATRVAHNSSSKLLLAIMIAVCKCSLLGSSLFAGPVHHCQLLARHVYYSIAGVCDWIPSFGMRRFPRSC